MAMFEELMINIMSTYDPVGFTQLNASLAEAQGAMTEFEATNAAAMAGMGTATAEGATLAEANMAKATGALNQFEIEAVAAENVVTTGLTPAMMGIDVSRLEQMGVDMEMATQKATGLAGALETIGPAAAMGFAIILAAVGAFAIYAGMKAMQVQKDWALFAGSLGYTSSQVGIVQGKFEGLFASVGKGTAHSTEDILGAAQQMASLGFTSQDVGKDIGMVGEIANVRFKGDMTQAVQTYNKSIEGSAMTLRNLGVTLNELGYTSTTWMKMTKDQRADILNSYLTEHGYQQANADYLQTEAGQWQSIKSDTSDITAQLGTNAMDLLHTSGILGDIVSILGWFDNNKGAQDWLIAIVGIGTAILGIVGTLWVLTKMKSMFDDVGDGVKGALSKIGVLNSTPCKSKSCVTKMQSVCANSGEQIGNSGGNLNDTKGKLREGEEIGGIGEQELGEASALSGIPINKSEVQESEGLLDKMKGKVGGGILGEEGGNFNFGGFSNIGAKSEGLLGKLGGLGRLGGIAGRIGLDTIPGIGEIAMAGMGAYGAYQGWTDTKGNIGDKAKGAVGGAVSSLSMGLVSQDQVVGGINAVDAAVTKLNIPQKLAGVGSAISQPFISGFNNAKSTVNNGINTIKSDIGNGVNSFKSYIGNGWNSIKTTTTNDWNSIRTSLVNDWNTIKNDAKNEVQNVYGFFANLPGEIQNGLGGLYNAIMSPLENALQSALVYAENMAANIEQSIENIPGDIIPGAGGDGTNLYTGPAAGGDGTNLYTGGSNSNPTITHNHTWNIESIGDKDTANHFINQLILAFKKENDSRGR